MSTRLNRLKRFCPHLLEPNGESVTLFGSGCASEKVNGVLKSVYGCELHGECITYAKGTHLSRGDVTRCVACGDNPANQRGD